MEDEAICVAIGLRLGVDLCHPHRCPCGATVDAKSIHGLSCKLAAGRMPRHQTFNDLVWRALTIAGVPSTKEASGMSRTESKRPDGLTLIPIPRQRVKSLAWDVTVVNILADSYISAAPLSQANVAEMVAERKILKLFYLACKHHL